MAGLNGNRPLPPPVPPKNLGLLFFFFFFSSRHTSHSSLSLFFFFSPPPSIRPPPPPRSHVCLSCTLWYGGFPGSLDYPLLLGPGRGSPRLSLFIYPSDHRPVFFPHPQNRPGVSTFFVCLFPSSTSSQARFQLHLRFQNSPCASTKRSPPPFHFAFFLALSHPLFVLFS